MLKTEIEHLQHFLERSKVKLMKDFEVWWAEQSASVEVCNTLTLITVLLSILFN